MGINTRLFAQDIDFLALYAFTELPEDVNLGLPLTDLLTIFTDFSIRAESVTEPGRATSETTAFPLIVEKRYTISIGGLVDGAFSGTTPLFKTIVEIFLDHGPGPYWIQVSNNIFNGYARAIIENADWGTTGGPQEQNATLLVQGDLTRGVLGS